MTFGFYLSPEILIFFEPQDYLEDGRNFWSFIWFLSWRLNCCCVFWYSSSKLEMNKNIRKILQILESKNKKEIPISKNKTPPEI